MRKITLVVISMFYFAQQPCFCQDDFDDSFIAADINYNHFKTAVANVSLRRYSEDSALLKLFPGKFYKIKTDGEVYTLVTWKSHNYPSTKSLDAWATDSSTFPYPAGNDTRITATLNYKGDNGNDFLLLATSTVEMGSLIPVGRFNCAQLGIAIFEKTNSTWILRAFNPAIVCAGSFSTAPTPELLSCDGHIFGCSINSTNGAAGGPYYGEMYVIGLQPENLKVLLHYNLSQRIFDGKAEWRSNVQCIPSKIETPDLILQTKGLYLKYSFDVMEDDLAPIRTFLGDAVLKSDSFNFEIRNNYKFEKDRYRLVERKVIPDN